MPVQHAQLKCFVWTHAKGGNRQFETCVRQANQNTPAAETNPNCVWLALRPRSAILPLTSPRWPRYLRPTARTSALVSRRLCASKQHTHNKRKRRFGVVCVAHLGQGLHTQSPLLRCSFFHSALSQPTAGQTARTEEERRSFLNVEGDLFSSGACSWEATCPTSSSNMGKSIITCRFQTYSTAQVAPTTSGRSRRREHEDGNLPSSRNQSGWGESAACTVEQRASPHRNVRCAPYGSRPTRGT